MTHFPPLRPMCRPLTPLLCGSPHCSATGSLQNSLQPRADTPAARRRRQAPGLGFCSTPPAPEIAGDLTLDGKLGWHSAALAWG